MLRLFFYLCNRSGFRSWSFSRCVCHINSNCTISNICEVKSTVFNGEFIFFSNSLVPDCVNNLYVMSTVFKFSDAVGSVCNTCVLDVDDGNNNICKSNNAPVDPVESLHEPMISFSGDFPPQAVKAVRITRTLRTITAARLTFFIPNLPPYLIFDIITYFFLFVQLNY